MNTTEFKHGEMKINLWFKKDSDVGAIADSLLDMFKDLTAFNHALEHKATDRSELHVARSQDINIFTDYKRYITVDPLTEEGELKASMLLMMMANHEDFTVMDANPLVVNN